MEKLQRQLEVSHPRYLPDPADTRMLLGSWSISRWDTQHPWCCTWLHCMTLQLFIPSSPASLLHLLLFLAHLFFPFYLGSFYSVTRHHTTLKRNLTLLPRRSFSDNFNVFYLKLSHYKASSDCTTSCRQFTPVCLAIAGDPRLYLYYSHIFYSTLWHEFLISLTKMPPFFIK